MKSFADPGSAELAIVAAVPGRAQDVARLRLLTDRQRLPVVSVVGKYNHGKSRLLNELLGEDAFRVADKRETVVLSSRDYAGVHWLDAPGLDADVDAGDDNHAMQATWLEADIRLFIHAVTEGELDASERALLESLLADAERTRRQTLFVLSQVDQASDDEQLGKIGQAIDAQFPGLERQLVSASRHRQGVDKGSMLLQTRSGIPALRTALDHAVAGVPQARAHESAWLASETRAELRSLKDERQALHDRLEGQQAAQRRQFDRDLGTVLDKVAIDIQALIDVPGPDHSMTPDSFDNQFKVTAGKLERNRLQVGYSKACIEINAVLIKHGATELPEAQKTNVRSLDSVMVAVMGVYVKYRRHLQQIFCEPKGRDHLKGEFTRYFELSADRVELASKIADAEQGLRVADTGLAALDSLTAALERPA